MGIKTEADITQLVEADEWMMNALRAAEGLNLPDWWIGAGFLRNKVWDAIEGNVSTNSRDVDLVYFNAEDTRPESDWEHDQFMQKNFPFAEWEVRNQARMQYKNDLPPYSSTADGISHWVETATCVAVKLSGGKLSFLFCYGTEDLVNLIARPVPSFRSPEKLTVFYGRIHKKNWPTRWPRLRIVED